VGGSLTKIGSMNNGITRPADRGRAVAAAGLKSGVVACGAAIVGPAVASTEAVGTGLLVGAGRVGLAGYNRFGEFAWDFDSHVHGPQGE
jgi:hypothetical protein